jgi:hypothetical protein
MTKDGLCLRHGNFSSISCTDARSISHDEVLKLGHCNQHILPFSRHFKSFLIFCFLSLSPYSALNHFLPSTITFIPSISLDLHLWAGGHSEPLFLSCLYSYDTILSRASDYDFPLLLSFNSQLLSHLFSSYIHTYSSTLKIPPEHQ